MASIRRTLIGIGLLLFTVPPPNARPASSDGFPWSSNSNSGAPSLFTPRDGRDQNGGSVQPGVIAPGGTMSGSGVAQGNIGPTQSGPGAAGLFTPSSPGNAAAYNAQVQGGLTASPIVDGNGANVRITVPMATPSSIPNYRQYSSGTAAGAGSGIGTGTANGTGVGTSAGSSSGISTSTGVAPSTSSGTSMGSNSSSFAGSGPASNPSSFTISGTTRTSIPARSTFVPRTAFAPRYTSRPTRLPHFSKKQTSPIGDITGAITYGDGQKVLLGSEGSAVINSKSKHR